MYIIYSFNYTNKNGHGYKGTRPPLSIQLAEHTTPARFPLVFVPLPRTNETKYVHTSPVIRTDKAY
nr:MAG TPA: hypothetical protein [Caudoviricetes sp.]